MSAYRRQEILATPKKRYLWVNHHYKESPSGCAVRPVGEISSRQLYNELSRLSGTATSIVFLCTPETKPGLDS